MKPDKPNEGAELRRRAQAHLQSQTPPATAPGSTEELQRLVQELQVHQIELEMQNEALRDARTREEALTARYTDLYNFAPVGYFTLGRQGEITQINLVGARLLGYDQKELLDKRFAVFISEADLPVFDSHFQQVFAGETPLTCEIAIEAHGGPLRFARLETALGPNGQECRVVAVDITQSKEAERALERSVRAKEALQKSIVALNACLDLDSALDCLLQKVLQLGGMDCGVVHLIEGQEAVLRHQLGLRSEFIEQLARRPLSTGYLKAALEHPDEMVNLITRFPEQSRLGQSHGLHHIYCIVLRAEQQPFGFLTVASHHAAPPGANKIALMRILALETQFIFLRLRFEERWRSILTSMSEGVVLQTAEGTIIDCNLSAEKMLGLSRGQILGWKAVREDGGAFLDEDYPAMVSLRTGESCRDVIMGLDQPDGSQRWINVSAEPMFRGGETRPYGVVTSFADVTGRKQLEERVRQSQKMEAIGHLTGGMAHEFNNILAAMMMNLELVETLNPGADVSELLQVMLGSCQRAARLIRQLLAFSRQSVMHCEPMDLAAAVSKQCAMLNRLLGERIRLEFSSADNLPWVNADHGLVDQVILNLCLNARDAMENGGLLQLHLAKAEVGAEQVKLHKECQPGSYVCLSVTDNGCGMDARIMQRLFEPFFTTKDIGQGTGLGLATVRGIVQQQGGWVEVKSCVGKGSTFQVYLPAVAQPPAAVPVPRVEKSAPGKGTILLVEDEPGVRVPARMLLARTGYVVIEAADGSEAMALWEEHRAEIDLVYTDMVMPGKLSGLDLAKHVVADKPGVKVIITSGYNTQMPDLSNPAKSSIIYLPKPCPAATLISLIQTYLQPAQ